MIVRIAVISLFVLCLTWPSLSAESIAGVDCAAVRKLTRIEILYWIKRLGLTKANIEAIKKQCAIK